MTPISGRRAGAALAAGLLTLGGAMPAHAAASRTRHATEVIVQFDGGTSRGARLRTVRAAGGRVVRDLHIIRALGVRLPAGGARRLARARGVRAVTPNAAMRPSAAPPT